MGLGFGFALIFCYEYWCIYRFMLVVVVGCCGGGKDGFTVGLRRWLQIWVAIGQSSSLFELCLGQIWWVYGCFGGGKNFQ